MKKINLKRISEFLSEKEMKNVMGGSGSNECSGCSQSECYGGCGGDIGEGTCVWVSAWESCACAQVGLG